MDFLDTDPSECEDMPSYQSSQQALCGIATVNDFAERGVALIQDYNQLLTKDEQQRQYLLQVVESHRRQFRRVTSPRRRKPGRNQTPLIIDCSLDQWTT